MNNKNVVATYANNKQKRLRKVLNKTNRKSDKFENKNRKKNSIKRNHKGSLVNKNLRTKEYKQKRLINF